MHDYTVKFSPGRQSDAVAEGNEQQLRRSMFVTVDAAGTCLCRVAAGS